MLDIGRFPARLTSVPASRRNANVARDHRELSKKPLTACVCNTGRQWLFSLAYSIAHNRKGEPNEKIEFVCSYAMLVCWLGVGVEPGRLRCGNRHASRGRPNTDPAIPGLTAVTDSSDLVGAVVTVHYDPALAGTPAGAVEAEVMVVSGPGVVATSTAGLWTFSISGPIFASPFGLVDAGMTTQGIDFIEIDLLPAGGVWDKTAPSPGTLGSASGLSFEPAGPGSPGAFTGGLDALGSWDAEFHYAGPPLGTAGDVFGTLVIDFVGNSAVGVFDAGDFMEFVADTDLIIPEPATLSMLLVGLIALGMTRRRR